MFACIGFAFSLGKDGLNRDETCGDRYCVGVGKEFLNLERESVRKHSVCH